MKKNALLPHKNYTCVSMSVNDSRSRQLTVLGMMKCMPGTGKLKKKLKSFKYKIKWFTREPFP